MTRVKKITATEKPLLGITLLLAGAPARLRVQRDCIRAVFAPDFDRQAVADALNAEGFRYAFGQLFTRYSFNGNETYVRGVAV